MRLLSKKKQSLDIKAVLSFALPVILAALAFLFAQTEPGCILPKEATLRHSKTDPDIITTVINGAKDHDSILDALCSDSPMMQNEGIKRIIAEYTDPFFILSLCMEGEGCMVFLFVVFFIRFGLAGLSMQRLLSGRIKCGPYFEVLLPVLYSLTSISMLSSLSVSAMDLMILFPLMLKAFDELIMPGQGPVSIKCVIVCSLVFITGIHGLIQGLFAVIVFAVFTSVTRYGRFTGVMRSLARISLNSLLGLLITSFINIPRFACISYEKFPPDMFEEGKMTYALFDLFASNASGIAVDSSAYVVPAMYIGIITFMLIVILYLNRSIPVRIKMTVMIITVLVYATCSYEPVARILSFAFYSTAGSVSRLSALVVILFVTAAISAKNLSENVRNTVYAAALTVIAVVLISNTSENVYGYMNYQLFVTPASAIVSAGFLISYIRAQDRRNLAAFALVSFAALFLNTSYSMMMSAVSPSDFVVCSYEDSSDDAVVESDVFMSVYGDRRSFVVVSEADMITGDEQEHDPAAKINELAAGMLIDEVYTKIQAEEAVNEGFECDENGVYKVEVRDSCELILSVDPDEDIYVSSGINGPVHMSSMESFSDRFPDMMYYFGPFICRVEGEDGPVEVSLSMDDEGVYSGRIGIYYLQEHELGKMMIMTGDISMGCFVLEEEQLPFEGGSRSLITGLSYDDNIKVTVHGHQCETYNYQGLLAAHIGEAGAGSEVRIVPELAGTVTGTVLTVIGIALTVCLIILSQKMPDNRNSRGGISYA